MPKINEPNIKINLEFNLFDVILAKPIPPALINIKINQNTEKIIEFNSSVIHGFIA